jgi:ERCC4-related helicase
MFAILGDKFHEITKDAVRSNTCPLCVLEPIATHWAPDLDECLNPDGTLNYTALITNCIENTNRNRTIAGAINFATSQNGATLVLSERVAHLKHLAKMCAHTFGILSTARKSEREALLGMMAEGKIKVLFATYAIAKEGLDIPCLQNLVIASPVKDEITVTQSAGRVMRTYPGKTCGYIWEFEDDMRMLQKWLQKRLSIYKRVNA